ncbi:hypothetical protein C0991_003850 [Blastosporella zonata]|nr:hypothetical protein C0991_003850 [Blastosporella zonata]
MLNSFSEQKAVHTNLKIRAWSVLAIAALQEQKENWYTGLFAQLPSFSYAYHGSIRAYSQGGNNSESALVDLNHAYIAVKLWILLAYRVSGSGDVVKDSQTFNVWNELWPPFESLIERFELDSGGGALNRLRQLGPGETINQKLTRALRYMSEPPPETSFETLVNQAAKDIVAAEKLRVLETKVVQDRKAPEKHRKDMRAMT